MLDQAQSRAHSVLYQTKSIKIIEKLISKLIFSDMEAKLDLSQFGNQRGIYIQHYLIQMLHVG